MLDRFEISLDELSSDHDVYRRMLNALDLGQIGETLGSEQMIELLAEQFDAASEFVYSHPIWQSIREGSQRSLFAYMLETRHYLAAAASRMAPSIHFGIGLAPLALLLSHHLLEEWDHECFFSQALVELGCPIALIRSARPLPTTLEWIHFARFVAAKSSLSAAACSGFMEHSSTEAEAVKSWHSLLTKTAMLPAAATASMFAHFETDLGFDHAKNWQRAVRLEPVVTALAAQEALNDVCNLAEMIYRWLSSLPAGVAADTVTAMQVLNGPGCDAIEEPHPLAVNAFSGVPVFPSTFLAAVTWGQPDATPAGRIVTAASYGFGHIPTFAASAADSGFASTISSYLECLGAAPMSADLNCMKSVALTAENWLCTINGHDLWNELLEIGSDSLIVGYFIENYHYLASAARHIAPAIASSDNPSIRRAYIAHLEDELEHCNILRDKLIEIAGVEAPERLRPLPTTIAFVGYLEMLARTNWRAYVIVSTFLQSSLSASRVGGRHKKFYARLIERNGRMAALVQTMAAHDDIDEGLDHDNAHYGRLEAMLRESPATLNEIWQAAIVPSLAWSFLDGILQHYASGEGAILQRAGWQAR